MQFGNLSLKRCRHGWMLCTGPLSTGPYVGTCLELYGQYSESEVRLLTNLVDEGNTIIDVGAHIGALAVPMAQAVGSTGRIYAIESHPGTFNVLCANLALNGIRNVKPLNALVAPQRQTMEGAQETAAFAGEASAPGFLALDSLALESCHLIKVDVDGDEVGVLRSGEMQIERFRPILYFENEVRENSAELLNFVLKTLNYHAYFHPAPLFEPDNFFGNPVNHWAPSELVSMMILAVPAERELSIGLKRITQPTDWWDFSVPVGSYYTAR